MGKLKKKTLAIIMAMTMLFSMVTSAIHISAELTPPHLSVNLTPSEVNLVPGQEFTVEVSAEFLTADAWSEVALFLHYDYTQIEIIPYLTTPVGSLWVGIDPNALWRCMFIQTSIMFNPRVWGNSGHVSIRFFSLFDANPHPPSATLRFRVLEDAVIGETLIRWEPITAWVWTSPLPLSHSMNLYFAEPSVETYARVMIAPQIAVNLESQAANLSPGDEFLVYVELTTLTEVGWNMAHIAVYYDRTRLEIIPYSMSPYPRPHTYVGFRGDNLWRIFGGGLFFNPRPLSNHECDDIWMVSMLFDANLAEITFPATVAIRFRVREDAEAGNAFIGWAPSIAGAVTPSVPAEAMYFTIPTLESFASVTIGS